ncbi:peptide ABC transporter substrate-binding protein [Brevibacillus fluminis]|uniref:peptide ABC transporter substrate-binding protein n=1 Tax=Brevibacillus fluminis TaxID=511487 RepID=UPI003F8A4693
MKKRNHLLIGWFVMAIAIVTGCTNPNQPTTGGDGSAASSPVSTPTTTGTSQEPQILKTNLLSEPPSVDPALAEDVTSMAMVRAAFDGLTRKDKNGKLMNSVAERVDASKDMMTYTFKLRDTRWSNGDPVTAQDFEFAWKRALDPKTASPRANQLYFIKNGEKANRGEVGMDQVGVKAQDDKTLVVTLEKPTPYFLELTSDFIYYPVNQKVVSSNPKWAMEAATLIGNGPFKLETWNHKSNLVFVKNDQYWDKNSVTLEKLDFSIINDENTALSMFENGEFNWLGSPLSFLPVDAIPELKSAGKLTTQPVAATYWYEFNTEKPPFSNASIRKAFAYAINRQEIVDHITQTNEVPAFGLVPGSMTLKPDGYFTDNQEQTAKNMLEKGMKELGIKELPPITLSFNTAETHKKIAEAIQAQWKSVLGVEVKLENKEFKVFLEDLHQGNFQIGRLGSSASINDPIEFLKIFKDKNESNMSRWENPRYKELLNRSDLEQDPEKRREILKEAESLLMDEMPIAPIYYYSMSWVKNDHVKGPIVDNLAKVDFKWVSIE